MLLRRIKVLKDKNLRIKSQMSRGRSASHTPTRRRKTPTDKDYACAVCGDKYTMLEHLYRHIRRRKHKDAAHSEVANIIGQTYCTACKKDFSLSTCLVRLLRKVHIEIYTSRCSKIFWNGLLPPSQPLTENT